MLVGFLLLSFVASLFEAMGLALVFPLLAVFADPMAIHGFGPLARLAELFGAVNPPQVYWFLVATIASIVVFKGIFMAGFHWLQVKVLTELKMQLIRRLLRIYLYSDYDLHLGRSTADVIRNLQLAEAVYGTLFLGLIRISINTITLAGLVALLMWAVPGVAVIGLALIGGLCVWLGMLMRQTMVRIGRETIEIKADRIRAATEAMDQIALTKVHGKEAYFVERFERLERQHFTNERTSSFLSVLPRLVTESAAILGVLAMTLIVLQTSNSANVLPMIGVVAATLIRIGIQCNMILGLVQGCQLHSGALRVIAEELEDLGSRVVEQPPGGVERLAFASELSLVEARYHYPGQAGVALNGVDLKLRPNEFIGITGPSGSGKSTLMKVLLGLLVPHAGMVAVDGVPLQEREQLRKWQRGIGYVPQEVLLLDGSIAENVAFGSFEADIDRDRVFEALQDAELTAVVDRLGPAGLETRLGTGGAGLSAGERQRIGIARALYRKPTMLALDEATSALDNLTEHAISRAIERLRGTMLIVAIAHRLNTLQHCDRILLMEEGQIAAVGSYDELLERSERFRELVELARMKSHINR